MPQLIIQWHKRELRKLLQLSRRLMLKEQTPQLRRLQLKKLPLNKIDCAAQQAVLRAF